MKYLIKCMACLLITITANCQVTTTLPLSTYDYPNGAYLKDLNNELSYLEGAWEGIINNKKYTFVFTKFIQHLTGDTNDYYYQDEIRGKCKVVNLANNQVLYDNLAAVNYEDYSIHGVALRNGHFSLWFKDVESKCYNSVSFYLLNTGQTNKVKYCNFRFDSYNFPNCPNYPDQLSIPMYLPQVELILTKQ